MIPNHQNRNVQTSGVAATGEFQISMAHSAHIMRILRSQLYSDKILAVLREYSANAWDANREVGKKETPIKVTLPTVLDPTLYIRDFGPGISHEDMFHIYAQYGVSTKRGTDGQVGMLGIGSKSGFAYTDSFTITTWQQGVQRIYAALLNNDEKGSLNLLDESDSFEQDGTQIQIPVRPVDIPAFVSKAEKLFIHFKPRPDINTTLPPEVAPETILQHGTISRGHGEWHAVMGCIAYIIDLEQLRGLNAHRGGAGPFLDRLDGYLYFDIGDVEIAASREGLEYSDKTKAKLIDKFIDLVDEFVKHTLDKIEEGDFSFWEKRCRAQVINDLHLPVPEALKILTDDSIEFEGHHKFVLTYGHKQTVTKHVHVGPKTRLLIRDEIRKIDGYGLTGYDYVVRPNKDLMPEPTIDEVRAELAEFVEKLKITGVQISDISTVPWHAKAKFNPNPVKVANRKHQAKVFVLDQTKNYFGTPYSGCWNIETVTQQPNDVFVLLRKFKVIKNNQELSHGERFYGTFMRDREMFQQLNLSLPKIYGYKSTEKEPVDPSLLPGRSYYDWRKDYFLKLFEDPRFQPIIEALEWLELMESEYHRNKDGLDMKVVATLFKKLGSNHPVCDLFRKIGIASRYLKRIPEETIEAITRLREKVQKMSEERVSIAAQAKEGIEKLYPMFELFHDGLNTLMDDGYENQWVDYIQLVDRAKKGLSNEGTIAHSNGRSGHGGVEGQTLHRQEGSTELLQPQGSADQGEAGRGLGEDRGSPVGNENGEGMVERQVQPDRGFRDLLRAASA